MTIVDAAAAVLREANRSMTVSEIYSAITARGLYDFKAKQPVQVLLQQLKRHCVGVENAASSKTKAFARQGEDRFVLLPDASEKR